MKKLLILLTLTMMFGQIPSPCEDELYLELKNKKLDDLSEREYKYFLSKDTQCSQYLSTNSSTQLISSLQYTTELSSLKSRKMFDLVGLTTIYGLTIGITAVIDEGIEMPLILIPAIGPFLVLDEAGEDYTAILLLSGVIQTAFLLDHNLTMGKISKLNNNLSLSVSPHPTSLSATLSYHFN